MKTFHKIVFSFSIINLLPTETSAMGARTPGTTPPSSPSPSPTPPPAPPRSKYAHLDPKRLVPRHLLERAVNYFDANQSKLNNKNFITVIDFSKHSGQRRFFLVNMKSGDVEALHTSHGKNSDPDHNGYADEFSNVSGSNMSSLGFYVTGGTYQGGNGYSLYLDGLSSTNSNARARAIVIHGADYVSPSFSKQGRSFGCPALDMALHRRVIDQIKGKSLIYAAND